MNEENIDPDLAPSAPPAGRSRGTRSGPDQLLVLGVIFAGGTAGTLARAAVEDTVSPGPGGWPWATFLVNISGALVLGFLLEVLAGWGPDSGWRRQVRLGAGTGFLGGWTTYSTLAVEVSRLSWAPPHLTGPGYAAASLLLGPAAAAFGYLAARRRHPSSTEDGRP